MVYAIKYLKKTKKNSLRHQERKRKIEVGRERQTEGVRDIEIERLCLQSKM